MGALDVAVVVAIITAFGGFAGGLVTLFGSKNQKVIDLISSRLAAAEARLDTLEHDLQEERARRIRLLIYNEALTHWARRVWDYLTTNGLQFDPPPIPTDERSNSAEKEEEPES